MPHCIFRFVRSSRARSIFPALPQRLLRLYLLSAARITQGIERVAVFLLSADSPTIRTQRNLWDALRKNELILDIDPRLSQQF